MQRRHVLFSLAALPWLISGCGGGGGGDETPPSGDDNNSDSGNNNSGSYGTKPNVLFISIDDLNDWTGFLAGHPQVQTPHLDALAASASVFTKAYCNAPLCNPSRSSALTGLLPHQTRVYSNNDRLREQLPSVITLPQHFLNNGYHTVSIGKVFHYADSVSWSQTIVKADDPLPTTTPANNLHCATQGAESVSGYFDWAALDISADNTADGKAAASAIDFLQQTQSKPFFLALGFSKPHLAWYLPKEYFEQYPLESVITPEVYADDRADLPATALAWLGRSHEQCVTANNLWQQAVQAYLAAITFVDAQLGKVMAAFEASAHANNTVVVLWSDNGYHLGEKFKWQKSALWERTTHVPLLIQRPAQNSRQTIEDCVSLIDLFPTLIDLCQLPSVNGLSGRSLLPLLSGNSTATDSAVITTHGEGNHAVRKSQWRLIQYADGSRELYDHSIDPNEWYNVANDVEYTAIINELIPFMPT